MKFDERQEQEAMVIRPLENRLDSYVAEEFKVHMKAVVHNGHLQIGCYHRYDDGTPSSRPVDGLQRQG
jgi:hypothetical protein